MRDEIVEEIRRIRENHAATFNYDINEIFDDFKRKELERNLPRVSLEPHRIAKASPA